MSVNFIQHNKYLQHVITAVIFYTPFGARLARFLLVLHTGWLEPPSLLVQVVDGPATVAKLVKKILDLVSKIL